MKRSQITMFVLIGVAVLVFFGIILMMPGTIQNSYSEAVGDGSQVAYTKSSLHSYVQDCLKDVALEAVDEQGILSNSDIESYVNLHLGDCIDQDSLKASGIEIELDDVESVVSLGLEQKAMVVDAVIPIILPMENGERSEMDEFHYSMDIIKDIELETDDNGALMHEVRQMSGDRDLELILPEGVIAYDEDGNPVDEVEIKVIPNDDPGIVGKVQYELNPPLVFSSPVELVFDYDGEIIADESQLNVVFLSNGIWRAVDTKIDTELKQVMGEITHFSTYALHGNCGNGNDTIFIDTGNLAEGKTFSTEDDMHSNFMVYSTINFYYGSNNDEKACIRSFEFKETFTYPIFNAGLMNEVDGDESNLNFDLNWLNKDYDESDLKDNILGRCISYPIGSYASLTTKQAFNPYFQERRLAKDPDMIDEAFDQAMIWAEGDNELRFTMYNVMPDKLKEKIYREGKFYSASDYCMTFREDEYGLCMDDLPYTEFDWVGRFLIAVDGNFKENLGCEGDGPCIDISDGEFLDEDSVTDGYIKNIFYSLGDIDFDTHPIVVPAVVDGSVKWRDNDCLCGNGVLDEYEACDPEIVWTSLDEDEDEMFTCDENSRLNICDDECRGQYPAILKGGEIMINWLSFLPEYDEEKNGMCWWDSTLCNMGEEYLYCDGKLFGEKCTDKTGTIGNCNEECKCIPSTCGDGVVTGDEVCDTGLHNWTEGSAKYCGDYYSRVAICNDDCTGYNYPGTLHVNCGASVECNEKEIGETCFLNIGQRYGVGYCDQDGQCYSESVCGDGYLDNIEVCDRGIDNGTGYGNMYYCEGNVRLSYCSDCIGYVAYDKCYNNCDGIDAICNQKEIGELFWHDDGRWGFCNDQCQFEEELCGNRKSDSGEVCENRDGWGIGWLHYCYDNRFLMMCNDDCTAYVDQHECWWDDEYCNGGSVECNHKEVGESCRDVFGRTGVCGDDCKCTGFGDCGNGILDEDEMCDSGNSVEGLMPYEKGTGTYCEDNLHISLCSLSCDSYYKTGTCGWDDEHCNGGSKECSGKSEWNTCILNDGRIGFCNGNCECTLPVCGNGVIEPGEACENADSPAWGYGRLHYCPDNMHLFKCNEDCTGYVDQNMCWWDENYCNGGDPIFRSNPEGTPCTRSDGKAGKVTKCRCE